VNYTNYEAPHYTTSSSLPGLPFEIFSSAPCPQTPSIYECSSLTVRDQLMRKSTTHTETCLWERGNSGSSVSVVTRLRTGWPGLEFRQGLGLLSSSPSPDRLWGPQSLISNEYRRFFPRGQRSLAREVDHSPPSCVGRYPNTSSWRGALLSNRYVFMAWYLLSKGTTSLLLVREKNQDELCRRVRPAGGSIQTCLP
jgi:hypothetical protein